MSTALLDHQARRSEGGARPALAAAVLGFYVITLDAVVVNVALPSMRQDLGGSIAGLQWIVDGYTLMFAALLLSAGAITDRVGARRAFTVGVVIFVLASLACGLAPGVGALVAARFVQGAAAAVMTPSSMALIGQAYPDPVRRARAVAVWAVGGAVASTSGPILGGLLTTLSWRWIFLLNLPAGALTLALLSRSRRSPRRDHPIDAVGQVTAVVAMGGLTYGVIEAGEHGLTAPRVLASLVVAVAAAAAFVASQIRGAHPMVPPDLIRLRPVAVSVAVGFAFVVGFYGLPFVMSLYLQQVRQLSALETGVAFLPMMLGGLLSPFSARLGERFGARKLVTTGLLLMVLGLIALAVAAGRTPVVVLAPLMVPVGLAGPLVMPPLTAVLLNAAPDHRAGTVSGVFNTSRQVGGALAVAVFGTLLANQASFLYGLRLSLLIAASCALAAAAATAFLLTARPTTTEPIA
jgi:EmrB/QacA subfamily drug resistance transporter